MNNEIHQISKPLTLDHIALENIFSEIKEEHLLQNHASSIDMSIVGKNC